MRKDRHFRSDLSPKPVQQSMIDAQYKFLLGSHARSTFFALLVFFTSTDSLILLTLKLQQSMVY